MSLFPAYTASTNTEKETTNQEKDWLTNSSYDFPSTTNVITDIPVESIPIPPTQDCVTKTKDRDHKKFKKDKQKKIVKKKTKKTHREEIVPPVIEIISDEPDLYCIDKNRQLNYLNLSTLKKALKLRYYINFEHGLECPIAFESSKKKRLKRYYECSKSEVDEPGVTAEEEITVTKKAEEFNKKLCESSDIAEWMEFIEFQDEFFNSQHISYKTASERRRAIFQKKLDILQKAMSYNLKNEELEKYWIKIAQEILPVDQILKNLEKMLKESPDNLPLWLQFVSVKQQNLALCTFPSVSDSYKKAINALKSVRTDDIEEKDSNVRELLFHYCKLLDHCGQWEILLTIVKNNINLNLGTELKLDFNIEDERMKDLENEIIADDKQPIWVTWSRLENIREGLHFLPVAESEDYPQRCISTEDIIDFVLHFHRGSQFRLIVTLITLLKVPLLPLNGVVLKVLFKNGLPWVFDSPELILSAAFYSTLLDIKLHHLRHVTQLTRGPQYLRNVEGQSEFLELIQKTFQECTAALQGKQRVSIALWWLRFNRWLYILDKNNLADLQVRAKKMKTFFKDFMKNPENRDNLLFYCEYSLFEFNQGKSEASIKTLKTLISSRPGVYHLSDQHEKGVLCFVYRCLTEIFIAKDQRKDAVKLLVNLGIGADIDTDITIDSLTSATHKFRDVAIEFTHEFKDSSMSLEDLTLPHFVLEWISCYMWLLALTKSTSQMKDYANEVCSGLSESDGEFSEYAREHIQEMTAVIHWTLDRGNIVPLSKVLNETLRKYPNNLKVLSMMASKYLEDNGLWWTFKQSFLSCPSLIGYVILVTVALERTEMDTEGLRNRLRSLFREVLQKSAKLSSVVHCLRLRFLHKCDHLQLDAAQLSAIESCPWHKSVYMSAIAAQPDKLMQLTDVMIEKELRIHVTPDEIQEMRD